MKVGLFSCAKNEGPFMLEWVAYHSMIGFSPILVFSNDCDDGTDVLLDTLAEHGVLHHVRQHLEQGQAPQFTAADAAFTHPCLDHVDWLMWIDTDEFLRIEPPGETVQHLVGELEDADGICVNWRIFGDAGLKAWSPGLVTQQFTRRAEDGFRLNAGFKTLFRRCDDIRGFGLHRPFFRSSFGKNPERYLVNAAGDPMPEETYKFGQRKRHGLGAMPMSLVSYQNASLHHYAVKTYDTFQIKKNRGQGTKGVGTDAFNSRFRDRYWTLYNQNCIEDRSMLEKSDALARQISALTALSGVSEAAEACNDLYRRKLRRIAQENETQAP